jgi:hypothetical protein
VTAVTYFGRIMAHIGVQKDQVDPAGSIEPAL